MPAYVDNCTLVSDKSINGGENDTCIMAAVGQSEIPKTCWPLASRSSMTLTVKKTAALAAELAAEVPAAATTQSKVEQEV